MVKLWSYDKPILVDCRTHQIQHLLFFFLFNIKRVSLLSIQLNIQLLQKPLPNWFTLSEFMCNLLISILRHFLPFFNFSLIFYDEHSFSDNNMHTKFSKHIFESMDLKYNLILQLVNVAQLTSPGVQLVELGLYL